MWLSRIAGWVSAGLLAYPAPAGLPAHPGLAGIDGDRSVAEAFSSILVEKGITVAGQLPAGLSGDAPIDVTEFPSHAAHGRAREPTPLMEKNDYPMNILQLAIRVKRQEKVPGPSHSCWPDIYLRLVSATTRTCPKRIVARTIIAQNWRL